MKQITIEIYPPNSENYSEIVMNVPEILTPKEYIQATIEGLFQQLNDPSVSLFPFFCEQDEEWSVFPRKAFEQSTIYVKERK